MTTSHEARNTRVFNGRTMLMPTARNKRIREALANTFPDTKFKVANGVGGRARVTWADGPTRDAVENVAAVAVEGTCGLYGQYGRADLDRQLSLTATVAALTESWLANDIRIGQYDQVLYSMTTEPQRADVKPYTSHDLLFYAAVAQAAAVTEADYEVACANDRRATRSGRASHLVDSIRERIARTLYEMGDSITAALFA